jgi:hypothetical protein
VGEQPANDARRDPKAELLELAGDPLVAPPGVLARQPQHEFGVVASIDGRPALALG